MIRADKLTLRRGSKVLLENTSFIIHAGERVGVVGKNGAGKSSLFALLQGELEPDRGQLSIASQWQIATVEQHIRQANRVAREFVIDGDQHLRNLQEQRAAVSPDDGAAIAELEMALNDANAWSAESRAESLLSGLGFSPEDWLKPVKQFSGGWQMRLALARALMAPSDLLLLDEPTNHLDLNALYWLENWLASYSGTVLIISHDPEFLERTTRAILHFDHKQLVYYRGSYESFVKQRAERLRQHEQAVQQQSRERERLQAFIDRFKAQASKARQAQSRVKALERLQVLAPLRDEAGIQFQLPQPGHLPDPLVVLDEVCAGYQSADSKTNAVLEGLNLSVRARSRIGVLGVNGAGKTTLIRTLAGELPPLSGKRTAARRLQVGYFAQQQVDQLDANASPLQHLQRIAPEETEQDLRDYLGRFGFSGDMALAASGPLSGGEKARLAFALLVWEKPNLLLLDEPSNHLDTETREALSAALAEFQGSVLLVSHDRHLLRSTVDAFWIVKDGQVSEFDGDLDDYRQWLLETQRQSSGVQQTEAAQTNSTSVTPERNRREQRRLEAEQRQTLARLQGPIKKQVQEIENQLERLHKRMAELKQVMSEPDLYSDDKRRDERLAILEEHGELEKQNEACEARWLSLQEQLEQIANDVLQE